MIKAEVSSIFVTTGFLNSLFDAHKLGEVDSDVAENVFRDVVSNLALDIHLDGWQPSFNGADLAKVVSRCLEFKFRPEVAQLLQSISAAAPHAKHDVYRHAIFPFIENFSLVLREHDVMSPDGDEALRTAFTTFTTEILDAYWTAIMPKHPTPPIEWKQDTLKCRCTQCQALDDFFQDPCKESTQIQVLRDRHLEDELKENFVDCKPISSKKCHNDWVTYSVTKRSDRYNKLVEKRKNDLGGYVDKLVEGLESIGVDRLQALLGSDRFTRPLKSCLWVEEAKGR